MNFYSVDEETRSASEITEPRTLSQVSRIVGTAIGRWLLSGEDLPDYQATDGVSEFEAAREF